jgi:hypothetical protein
MSATPSPFSDPELSAFMQKLERAIENSSTATTSLGSSLRRNTAVMGSMRW